MSYNSILKSVALSIEVGDTFDKEGNTVYRKRNYSGIKGTATAEQLGIVAQAIKNVTSFESRDTFKNSVEQIANN